MANKKKKKIKKKKHNSSNNLTPIKTNEQIKEINLPLKHKFSTIIRIIFILSIIGIILSGYSVYLHYKDSSSSFCNLGEKLNCDVVNKSSYSSFLGVPVAIIGVIGYFAITFISFSFMIKFNIKKIHLKLKSKHLMSLITFMSSIGLLFSIYLSIIEEFILQTWCIICISSAITISAIFILTLINSNNCRRCKDKLRKIDMKSKSDVCKHC